MAKKETLVHLRLEYGEAIRAKKDVLSSQAILLKIIKRLNHYGAYRMAELELKAQLYKKTKELKNNISNLQKTLPRLEIPDILRHEGTREEPHHKETRARLENFDVESQLMEIQRRLEQLQNEENLIR